MRASSDAARATSERDAERFSLPEQSPKAKDARDPKAAQKDADASSGPTPKDGPAPRDVTSQAAKAKSDPSTDAKAADPAIEMTRRTSVAIAVGDRSNTDIDVAEAAMASAPIPAAAPTDTATPPPVTRQPGFLALMRALGIANDKTPTQVATDDRNPAAPEPTIAIAGTPAPPEATSAEAQRTAPAEADAEEPEEVKAEPGELATAAPSTPVPIMLPTPPEASPSPVTAEIETGGATAITDNRKGPAAVAVASGPAAPVATTGLDATPAKDTRTGSAVPGDASAKEPSVAGTQPEKQSFGEHVAKATAEAIQTGSATPIADPTASMTPSQPGVPAPAPGLHVAPAHAAGPAVPTHPVVSGVPISAVPVEIGMKSLQGVNRFDIRLDPDDLGQIDVRLDISETGSVRAHIVVERPEALASLQRETSHLERALEQAGFRAEDGVSLSLRQHTGGEAGNGRGGDGRETRPDPTLPGMTDADAATTNQPTRRVTWTRASGIDRHI